MEFGVLLYLYAPGSCRITMYKEKGSPVTKPGFNLDPYSDLDLDLFDPEINPNVCFDMKQSTSKTAPILNNQVWVEKLVKNILSLLLKLDPRPRIEPATFES